MRKQVANIWISSADDISSDELLACAYSMIDARKALHGPLPSHLLGDPALEILLTLYASYEEGTILTADDIANGSSVPASVVSRWLRVLEDAGSVVIENDNIYLSNAGISEIRLALGAVIRSQIARHGNN